MNDSFSREATARTGPLPMAMHRTSRAEGTFDWVGREVWAAVLRTTQSLVFGADHDRD
jgi:hypothetical protein